jgi:hypothetical protein
MTHGQENKAEARHEAQAGMLKVTAGRPTDYRPAYTDEVTSHLGEGFTLASFAGIVGASRQTVYDWADAHPEFLDAIKKGRAKGQYVWEKRLTSQAIDGKGNTAAIIFAMKNLYQDDWAEKIINEHTGKDGGPIEVAETHNISSGVAKALAALKGGKQ